MTAPLTKARPPLAAGDVFLLLWPDRVTDALDRPETPIWSHGDGTWWRFTPLRQHPCGALEMTALGPVKPATQD